MHDDRKFIVIYEFVFPPHTHVYNQIMEALVHDNVAGDKKGER